MSWPSMVARTLKLKLGFLFRLLASEDDNIASNAFCTLASQDVYSLGIVQQCIMLDSKIGTQSIATILNTKDHSNTLLKGIKKDIMIKDKEQTLQEVALHPSVKLAANINWLYIWDAVRDRGPYWSRITQSFFKILTRPLFGNRQCYVCSTEIPINTTYFEHLVHSHCQNQNQSKLLSELKSNS